MNRLRSAVRAVSAASVEESAAFEVVTSQLNDEASAALRSLHEIEVDAIHALLMRMELVERLYPTLFSTAAPSPPRRDR